jgi:hypothetical protein
LLDGEASPARDNATQPEVRLTHVRATARMRRKRLRTWF